MAEHLKKFMAGYGVFREKYAHSDRSVMEHLSSRGQQPKMMVVACCDSRVDPALILQCDPGDLFVVRNVANIVPPYERDDAHHGTSAALEFGLCFLNIPHLVLLGHSQCGGIRALLHGTEGKSNDFIDGWVSLAGPGDCTPQEENTDAHVDACAQKALHKSYGHCLTFPWIRDRLEQGSLMIHRWFFDIKSGQIFQYRPEDAVFTPL